MQQAQEVRQVTVAGLGLMGAALARALLAGGVSTTVWNRDREKIAPLVELGAHAAPTLADAIAASEVVIICIHGYANWQAQLDDLPPGLLDGRLIVQLSTGSADDATAAGAAHASKGARFLDGAILAFPSAVGTDACTIYLSGGTAEYAQAAERLGALGRLQHLGEDIHLANALDMAVLFFYFGSLTSFVQASALIEVAGLPADKLAGHIDGVGASLRHGAKALLPALVSGDYRTSEVTLDTMHGVWTTTREYAERKGLPLALLQALENMSERAIGAGHGAVGLGAMIEAFRPRGRER